MALRVEPDLDHGWCLRDGVDGPVVARFCYRFDAVLAGREHCAERRTNLVIYTKAWRIEREEPPRERSRLADGAWTD